MLLAAAIILASAQTPPARDTFVDVDGARYRVTVRGNEVTVNKKATVVRYSIKERDAQREAVRRATGCRIVDELAGSARLRGKLDCSPVS
jgi:hypothetical protein